MEPLISDKDTYNNMFSFAKNMMDIVSDDEDLELELMMVKNYFTPNNEAINYNADELGIHFALINDILKKPYDAKETSEALVGFYKEQMSPRLKKRLDI